MNDGPEVSPPHPEKDPSVPPPIPRNILRSPVSLGSLDRPIDLGEWRQFFSLSGGSILYCLSALCVITGVATILGDVFARSFALDETLPCIVALNVYEIALMSVLVLIVVWQNVTDDAISLVVLAAVFPVVTGVALTTTSNSAPRTVLVIGAVCFALAMGKVFVLRRFVGMHIGPVLWAGLAVVLGWNFVAGGWLSRLAEPKDIERTHWLVSWLVLLAGGVLVLVDASLRRHAAAGTRAVRGAFLRRAPMSWVFALVLLVAAAVHQRALAYVFNLGTTSIDWMPMVCLVSLILVQLSLHLRSKPGGLEAGLAAAPLTVFLIMLAAGRPLAKPVLGLSLLWYPPVFFGLTGSAFLFEGLRRRLPALVVAGGFYVLAVVLTSTASIAKPEDLNWHLAWLTVVAALFALGVVKRSAATCLAAVVVGAIGFAATDSYEAFIQYLHVDSWSAFLGLVGLGTLVVAVVFGRMHAALVGLAAVGIMIFAFDFFPRQLGMNDLYAGLVLLALASALFWRVRQWPAIVILCVPVAWRLAVAFMRLSSWRYVVLGFALLFVGAWLSIRKGKRTRREGATVTIDPGGEREGDGQCE